MKKILLAAGLCCAFLFPVNAETQGKWKPLFGNNLEEATYDPYVWSLQDGVLSANKDESIWTKVQYENFELLEPEELERN